MKLFDLVKKLIFHILNNDVINHSGNIFSINIRLKKYKFIFHIPKRKDFNNFQILTMFIYYE